MPEADNTVREAKNRFVMAWVHHQIARGRFRSGTLMMLRKSHTHDRIGLACFEFAEVAHGCFPEFTWIPWHGRSALGNIEQKTGELW